MATSFVNYKEKGFWINDQLLIIVANYLLKEFDNKIELENWEKEFRNVINDNAHGYFVGFMDFDFDVFLINQNRINSFNELINSTKMTIERKGEVISPDELNSFEVINEVKVQWIDNIQGIRLIKILDYIADLINGKLLTTASDAINYIF